MLDLSDFSHAHPSALRAWTKAAESPWSADNDSAYRSIGADCREAMQSFVTDLVDHYRPEDIETDTAKTRNG